MLPTSIQNIENNFASEVQSVILPLYILLPQGEGTNCQTWNNNAKKTLYLFKILMIKREFVFNFNDAEDAVFRLNYIVNIRISEISL